MRLSGSRDLDARRRGAAVAELAVAIQGQVAVLWRAGDVDFRLHEVPAVDQRPRRDDVHNVVPMVRHAGGERGCGQADDLGLRIGLDEIQRALVVDMSLVHDDQRRVAGQLPPGQRLRAADLHILARGKAGVIALHHAVRDAVVVEDGAGLVHKGHPVNDEQRVAALGRRFLEDVRRCQGLSRPGARHQQQPPLSSTHEPAQRLHRVSLVGAKLDFLRLLKQVIHGGP